MSTLSHPLIHIIIGTKAQYIKMMPIMIKLSERGIPFTLVDTGQHASTTRSIRDAFGIKSPDIFLSGRKSNIKTARSSIIWFCKIICSGYQKCKHIIKKNDICLVHGDTLSTLQGVIISRMLGARIAHIEAGERTYKLFSPFPEEIIRRITDRASSICFASSAHSYMNLTETEKVKGKAINIGNNTIFDAVSLAQNLKTSTNTPDKFVLVSIHRAETVYSQKRMKVIVDTVLQIAKTTPVIWGLHEITENNLAKNNLLGKLRNNNNIILRGLFDYPTFIKTMSSAEFIITDGGGPQEESYLLNTPCLLMRSETERLYYSNICLSKFKQSKIDSFLKNYQAYRSEDNTTKHASPSILVVNEISQLINSSSLQCS